jgi:hypothetical protein
MQRVDGSNWVMPNVGAQVHLPLRAPAARLRRQRITQSLEQLRAENAASNASDIPRLIGYGILLLAALLILVGSLTA